MIRRIIILIASLATFYLSYHDWITGHKYWSEFNCLLAWVLLFQATEGKQNERNDKK